MCFLHTPQLLNYIYSRPPKAFGHWAFVEGKGVLQVLNYPSPQFPYPLTPVGTGRAGRSPPPDPIPWGCEAGEGWHSPADPGKEGRCQARPKGRVYKGFGPAPSCPSLAVGLVQGPPYKRRLVLITVNVGRKGASNAFK